MIFPPLGSYDDLIRDIPLSVIYAATHSVKAGFRVRILDLRLNPEDWRRMVSEVVGQGCGLVGVSVMTGYPIKTGLAISRFVKEIRPGQRVVWGGPHPTVLPQQTLEHPDVDFVIRGWGSQSLCQLLEYLYRGLGILDDIPGLGWKEDSGIRLNAFRSTHEVLDHWDIPYGLVDVTPRNYQRMKNTDSLIFPVFTSLGCPYQCTFCITPALGRELQGKRWIGFDVGSVLDHMEFLARNYPIKAFQIYDDDAFIDRKRMALFFDGYMERGLHERYFLEFRGVRINELDRMDDDYLARMVRANVRLLVIGLESGSDRVLRSMRKNITREQVKRVNIKLARFPQLLPHYNFFCGTPGETFEDLLETKELILQLLRDNPRSYLGVGADWKPIPGAVMTEEAVRDYGLRLPSTLEEWVTMDSTDTTEEIRHPWYTPQIANFIKLMQITGKVMDDKVLQEGGSFPPLLRVVMRLLIQGYRPLLRWRLRHNAAGFLVEHDLMYLFFRLFVGRRT
ncbi:MAG: B12-binding domain-containing radical SAM protein [Magnetococcales bacterium]|nr:B12-binding domain-containing radical SAM protein [Magnetococcales bacterium]MBF0156168.1 B12-binding domain-containing radical SAM protein [Magnetococcales bacterium]